MSEPDDDSVADTLASDSKAKSSPRDMSVDETLASSTLADSPGGKTGRPVADNANFVPERELARGGMGRVVIAKDRRLDRTVALKLLQRDSPTFRARFEREASITARLAHPAIVPVYEAGTLRDGSPFYAMKLVEGTPLDATIERAGTLHGRLALLPRAMAVCEALAYAHSHRVIHRDLKPANVLVGSFGETVVIDWGLAKDLTQPSSRESVTLTPRADSAGDLTIDGDVVGTPSYMPPEQATGGTVDERADVYALGALLYHVVAGRPPYRGRTAGEILAAVEVGPPTPIAEVEPDVPEDLASIIGKAMARAPADRYPTAGELADELRRFIDGRLVASHRYSGAELVRRWLRKHRAAVVVAACALVVLAAGAAFSVHKIVERERDTARALAESQLEQGRQLLVSGDPAQATPFITAALAQLPDDPIARLLGTTAVRDAQRRIGVFDGTSAAFRPDGRELAIGRSDGVIDVIDPATGAKLRELTRIEGAIAGLDYSPDGHELAVATDHGAFVLDPGTGSRTSVAVTTPSTEIRFVPPRGEVVAVLGPTAVSLVSRDGKLIASDTSVTQPHDLELAPDGSAIAAVCTDASIAWSVPDLTRAITAPDSGAVRYSVVVDHGVLFTAGTDGVRRWGTDPAQLATGMPATLERFADGTLLADGRTIARDGTMHVFTNVTIQAAAAVDATHAITGGYDRVLRVWDLARTYAPAIVLDPEAATSLLVVDQSGTRAITRGEASDARVELWDISNPPAPVKSLALGGRIDSILAGRSDRLAVHSGGSTQLLSTAFEPIATVPGWPVAFRPARDELVTDVEGRLDIFSARTGARTREITDQPRIWHVAVSEGGTQIVTASEHHVALRDADWKITGGFDAAEPIGAIAVDDRGRVATGHGSGAIHIWDARAGVVLATATGHTANIDRMELHGDVLVTSSWDLSTQRWAFPSGRPLGILKRFERIQDGSSLSPDGSLLATAQSTAAVLVWETGQGRLVDQLPTTDALTSVAFVDARHIVAGGDGGHLEMFELPAPRTSAEILTLAAHVKRWRLEQGRAIEN